MTSPTIAETVAYLNEAGKPLMAMLVANIAESEQRCRLQMLKNMKEYYALRDQLYPRPKPQPYVNWTGD